MHTYKISIASMRSTRKCAYLKEKITFKVVPYSFNSMYTRKRMKN